MIEIAQRKWEQIDLKTLATLTRSTFNFEGRALSEDLGGFFELVSEALRYPNFPQEQIERHLTTLQERFPFETVFVATLNETIVGWTGVERQTENIGEMGRWHPYIANVPERDMVAELLISEVTKYAKENRMSVTDNSVFML